MNVYSQEDSKEFLIASLKDAEYECENVSDWVSIRQSNSAVNYLRQLNTNLKFGLNPETPNWISNLFDLATERFGEEGLLFLLNQFCPLKTYSEGGA
jgi:hypothetical protein